jgi:hypothetical protein
MKSNRITIKAAHELWQDSARFWLNEVKECSTDTINSVLDLMEWPDPLKTMRWAAGFGRGQVFTAAIMEAGKWLVWLEMAEGRKGSR